MRNYILFDIRVCQFLVTATCSKGLSPFSQKIKFVDFGSLLNGKKDVDTAGFDHLANRNDVPCYVTNVMFGRLDLLILNGRIYLECKEWSELLQ